MVLMYDQLERGGDILCRLPSSSLFHTWKGPCSVKSPSMPLHPGPPFVQRILKKHRQEEGDDDTQAEHKEDVQEHIIYD